MYKKIALIFFVCCVVSFARGNSCKYSWWLEHDIITDRVEILNNAIDEFNSGECDKILANGRWIWEAEHGFMPGQFEKTAAKLEIAARQRLKQKEDQDEYQQYLRDKADYEEYKRRRNRR